MGGKGALRSQMDSSTPTSGMSLKLVESSRNCCLPVSPGGGPLTVGRMADDNGSWVMDGVVDDEPPSAVAVINTISITVGALSILLNLIFLIATRFLKESATAYNRFMINLSISDIMSSLSFLLIHNWPRGPFANIDLNHDFYLVHVLPYLFRSAPWMFLTSYLLTLSCLTVNQYVAVCKPWRYSALVTRRNVNVALLVVWLFSSLQVIIPLVVLLLLNCLSDKQEAIRWLVVVSKVEMQVWMAFYALSSVFNIVLNLIVYRRIRKLKLKRRGSHMSNPEMANIRMKQDAFITVTLLLLACFLCRLPFPLMGIVGVSLVNVNTNMNLYITINAGIVLLLYLNCFADPIIYILRTKELRDSYRGMTARCGIFRCCCGTSRRELQTNGQSLPLTSVTRTERDSLSVANGTCLETEICLPDESPRDEAIQL